MLFAERCWPRAFIECALGKGGNTARWLWEIRIANATTCAADDISTAKIDSSTAIDSSTDTFRHFAATLSWRPPPTPTSPPVPTRKCSAFV